jgi:hypothetical protein
LGSLVKLRFNNVYRGGPFLLEQINGDPNLNLNLNLVTYMRIGGACAQYENSLKRNRTTNVSSLDIGDFFSTFKKGSGKIRKFLAPVPVSVEAHWEKLKPVKTFLNLTDITGTFWVDIKRLYCSWYLNFLPNKFKDFIFKFTNNLLGINVRVAHFANGANRNCTFCTLTVSPNIPDETFSHLFFDCTTTSVILEKFYNFYFSDLGLEPRVKKNIWFGLVPQIVRDKQLLVIASLFIQFNIWQAKLKGKLPSFGKINLELLSFLRFTIDRRPTICTNDDSYRLSRNWTELRRDGFH